ncbi:Acetyltransferase GNAT family [Furfurilactobacillus rossiae]|uniref:GNAT family N-acetyltransferase n=1 Tax=Furfurilactobacillus rossiae TaxID=231049 RepID=UPI0015B96041|nr:GNAT family N-acetyltransferase [Furfurilactobacillus rossiae]MCF6164696.1 GNAT family N-acetyltransferase [Furfurilactobacillus rossiae]QLE64985.1 Acetyltransferase GNAT family [Furfurilactobacillus rossiae]
MNLFHWGKKKEEKPELDIEQLKGTDGKVYEDAVSVRLAVFVDEQGIDKELELDGHDEDATHYVGYDHGTPVVTARVKALDDDLLQIQRVATIDWARHRGYAVALINQITADAKENGFKTLYLEAQETAISFYAKQSFEAYGQPFLEANIWHRKMTKELYPEE